MAAVEPVGPFPKIARQVLGADAVMGADEPGFDVAEQGMDDREERAGIGAFVLDHRGVLQMPAEGGVAAAITGEPVGQQMRPGCDIGLEKGAEFGARRGRQHGDPGVAGEEPVLTLYGGSPRPPMKVSSASRKPRNGRLGSSLSPCRSLCAMVHAV